MFVAVGSSDVPVLNDDGQKIQTDPTNLDDVDLEQVVLPCGLTQYLVTGKAQLAPLTVYAFIQKYKCAKVVCFAENRFVHFRDETSSIRQICSHLMMLSWKFDYNY